MTYRQRNSAIAEHLSPNTAKDTWFILLPLFETNCKKCIVSVNITVLFIVGLPHVALKIEEKMKTVGNEMWL